MQADSYLIDVRADAFHSIVDLGNSTAVGSKINPCSYAVTDILRFVFVEEFNKYCSENWDAYYSVETPTSKRYDFSNKENPCKVDYSNGQSAMVDFSIFLKEQDKLTRVALIEFKALNPDKQSYMKDYVKLLNEDQKFVYFIMIVKSANDRTIKSIAEKIKASYDNAGLDTEKKVEFRCLDLGTGKEI